jgi:hypothetical protein
MPLEEQIAALTAAVTANTAALAGLQATAKTRGGSAAAETKAPDAPAEAGGEPETGRRRGRPAGSTNKPAEPKVDDLAAKMEAFKGQVVGWINWDDPNASEADVKKEREDRRTFIVGVSGAFGVEKASLIPVEYHEKVLAAMEKFADGDDVNPASLAPQRKRG